ncbi:hypothetical protein C0991_000578 [Blastosporella zonata]|nr:hypothetical protein C0991_000578 [Blastosporella zonata]
MSSIFNHLTVMALVLAPSLTSAAIFPKDSLVKMLDPNGFRKVMDINTPSPPPHLCNVPTGLNKLDSLSKFFDTILDGTAELSSINAQAAAEEFIPDDKELEIERQQEAQRIALAHGGFVDLIDFEKAMKDGAGSDYHDKHGYPGMMGSVPTKKARKVKGEAETETSATPASNLRPADEL